MKQLSTHARAYVVAIVAAGAALLLFSGTLPSIEQLPIFLGLATATILASVFKLRLPTTKNRATMSAAFVVDFASLLLFGPHLTLPISALSALTQSTVNVVKRNPPHRVLFNISALIVTVQATGLVYQFLGGTIGGFVWPGDATPLLAAVMVYFVVNTEVVAVAVALASGQPVRRVWNHNFLWGAPTYFVGAAVAVVIAETIHRGAWAMLPLIGIPVYLTYRTYGVYVNRLEDEHRHREVIETLNEGMIVVRHNGQVALWNDAIERITGVSRDQVVGRSLVEAVPALADTPLPGLIRTVFETEHADTINHFAFESVNGRRTLEVRAFPFVAGATLFLNDITERAEAEQSLKQSEERYALAAAGANDGMWDWDLTTGDIYFSPRWRKMLGLEPDVSAGCSDDWFGRVHAEDIGPMKAALSAHISGQTAHFMHEQRIRHEDGTYRWVLCRGVAVRKDDGRVTRMAGSQTDITDRVAIREQLRHAALHDALTGLPNRALFTELLGQVLDRSRRHPEHRFAVLFLDVDRFKIVNDSLGHLIGDELLVTISRRLESCLREGDVIARLGGDEFTILLNDLIELNQADAIARRIQESLKWPFAIKGHELFVSASIGIALSHAGYTRPDDIMRDADTAMYRAKALGKARNELFDPSMHAIAVDRLSLENDLRRSLERGEFTLHYQPIVSLPDKQWIGFEALVRWQRDGKYVQPQDFIPVAEETGLIEALGAWILQEACRQAALWRTQYPDVPWFGVTVNISAWELTRPGFIETVRQAITSAGLRPGDLSLEVTESTLMANAEQAAHLLRELRAVGVKVYLDDFGTGFSSLSYLHRFPVDTLKIDRTFVATVSEEASQPIVESIIALARTLGAKVIAEGVETEEQMDELVRLGCRQAQGHFFAAPMSARAAGERMAECLGAWTSATPPLDHAALGSPRSIN